MGYSCSAIAGEIMDEVNKLDKLNPDLGEGNLVLERGREQFDGAMSGTVYRCFKVGEVTRARKIGSYRITRDGIERFSGLSKEERETCTHKGIENFYQIYPSFIRYILLSGRRHRL